MERKISKKNKYYFYVIFAVAMFVLINLAMWSTSFADQTWHAYSDCPKGIYFDAGDSDDDVRWSKADGNLKENIGINKHWDDFHHNADGSFTSRKSAGELAHSDDYADYEFSDGVFSPYWIFDLGLDLVPSSDSPSGWKLKFRYRTDTDDFDKSEDFKIRIGCGYWNCTDPAHFDYDKTYLDEKKFRDSDDQEEWISGKPFAEFREKCVLIDIPTDLIEKCWKSGTQAGKAFELYSFERAVDEGDVNFWLDEIVCDTN